MLSSLLVCLSLATVPTAQEAEAYLDVPFSALVEELPDFEWPDEYRLLDWMRPFVVLDGEGEAVPFLAGRAQSAELLTRSGSVCLSVPDADEVRGRVFLPRTDWSGMEAHAFVVPTAEFRTTRESFLRAKAAHYQYLRGRGLPGDAWFRHRRDALLVELGDAVDADALGVWTVRAPAPEMLDTLALFAGGRAVSENLQLDRLLPVPEEEELLVDLDTLEGIELRGFDWKPLLDPEPPALDVLARHVPADQHALFFSSFRAFEAQRAELDRGTAFLAAIDTRGLNLAALVERYQAQLALPWNAVVRAFAARQVKSLAITGGDPYFATGTDVAVLLETDQPEALSVFLANLRQAAAPEMQALTGEVAGVAYQGLETPGRGVSSYAAVLEGAVVVSNSHVGLAAVIEASRGLAPRLVDSDDYVFFRQRYPLQAAGDAGRDLGLLVVPDAAIRRWCGPRWRIASSRRVRAGAVLADLQAQHLDALVEGRQVRMLPERRFPLGSLQLLADGVASSEYGTLAFLTPIRELEFERVGTLEARNYERWRDGYQSDWSGFFDPLAVQLEVSEERVRADVSVLPLIEFSDYDWLRDLVGDARLAPGDGDPHAEAVFQLTFALDPEAETVREFEGLAGSMLPGVEARPFAWVGDHASVYFDRDEELLAAIESGETDPDQWNSIPVALYIDVKNGLQLVTFLTALRAMAEQTAPGIVNWHQEQEGEHRFVRISSDELGGEELSIYYATPPGAWIVSLHRETLLRALTRLDRRNEPGASAPSNTDVEGMSVALELTPEGLTLMGFLDATDPAQRMRLLAWAPLPILDEWKRRYPERDPVELQRRFWAEPPSCPAGGTYRFNAELGLMESSLFGSPVRPAQGATLPRGLETLRKLGFGLVFEHDGIRARAELLR